MVKNELIYKTDIVTGVENEHGYQGRNGVRRGCVVN